MTFNFGSISHGTLLASDLIPTFLSELRDRVTCDDDLDELASGIAWLENLDIEELTAAFYGSEFAADLVDRLIDELNEDLPPFVYFGAHPGDGSDFGYWFDSESFERSVFDKETFKTDELPDACPEGYDCVAVISDHGNVTLYDSNLTELYAIV